MHLLQIGYRDPQITAQRLHARMSKQCLYVQWSRPRTKHGVANGAANGAADSAANFGVGLDFISFCRNFGCWAGF